MTKTDLDIIIQGPFLEETYEILDTYLSLNFVNHIVVSCWDNDQVDLGTLEKKLGKSLVTSRVSVVKNRKPLFPGTDNRNMQIVSSRNGISFVGGGVPFAAKMRSDQHYDVNSMNNMYAYFKKYWEPHQIYVAGMYPNLLFHPRDHIFWGAKEDLKILFDAPLEINGLADRVNIPKSDLWKYYHEFTRTETYLGAHYISNFHPEVRHFLLHPELYLYDNSPKWHIARDISEPVTPNYFKAFPRSGVNFKWKRKGWESYPYDDQAKSGEHWAESEIPPDLDMGDNDPTFKNFVYYEIMVNNMYEKFNQVKSGDVVVDIGANVGVFPYSLKARNPARVVCLEPSESLARTLVKNLSNLPFKSAVVKCGIGSTDGIKKVTDFDWIYGTKQDTFETITLPTLVRELKIERINFLKVDCEGGEYDLFTAENHDWIRSNVDYIAAEFHLNGIENEIDKFIQFRDLYLVGQTNYRVFEPYIWKEVTHEIMSDDYIVGFRKWWKAGAQFMIYIDNR